MHSLWSVKNPPSLMVWRCCSGEYGCGAIHILPKWHLCQGVMQPQAHILQGTQKLFFMHDCSSPWGHKSVRIPSGEVQVFDWPGNSPDVNPIENCWSYTKQRRQNTSSVPCLKEALHKMWEDALDWNYYMKLSASMPKQYNRYSKLGVVIKY